MADYIKIRKADGTWVVRAGGAVLAESKDALELSEIDRAPVIYFPREDIAMVFLDQTDRSSHCPLKGHARFFTIETKNRSLKNVGWSYEDPTAGAARIKDHIAFDTRDGAVTIERM